MTGKQFLNAPNVISKPRFHRGGDSEARMNAAEIVIREVQGDSGFQVRQLFAEAVRQSVVGSHHS